ncbi:hypothetical protein EUX98_g3949 [Antrodiella citrinella]|uniref:Uncharacterized protein n=1 Tax=Antrodiella citrinella TaxID=2447956 RepID=A0A4S4N3B3_9APHY|nr:hypothetical protein EUX98_g3949 [Antrodiella citrinella]
MRPRSYVQILGDFNEGEYSPMSASPSTSHFVDGASSRLDESEEGNAVSAVTDIPEAASLPPSPRKKEDTARRHKRFSLPAVAISSTPVMARPSLIGEGKLRRLSLVLGKSPTSTSSGGSSEMGGSIFQSAAHEKLTGLYFFRYSSVIQPGDYPLPPLYRYYHEKEASLSQHDPSLPYPEGSNAKFLWLPNHAHKLGWGHAVQEVIVNAYLAYSSGRTFVFDNYTWNSDGGDYTRYNGKLIPSRIPLTAFLSGPAVGGTFPKDAVAPRAVSKEYFDTRCPEPIIIEKSEVARIASEDATAQSMMQQWQEKLSSAEPCIQVERNADPLFDDYKVFGSAERLLSIWPELSKSPIITGFRWSHLVHAAFDANLLHVSSTSVLVPLSAHAASHSPYSPIPGLLALHIRRGDYENYCKFLAKHSSSFTGFNSYPPLIDTFEPLSDPRLNLAKKRAHYMPRCFPDIQQIVEKVSKVRRSEAGQDLKEIFIMTNAPHQWISELKIALAKAGFWDSITSSRDLVLNWEQKYVSPAVDMLIGQRAQVFIGNGFSSLTSNVVMLRLALGYAHNSMRFW